MQLKTALRSRVIQWMTSQSRQWLVRKRSETMRRISGHPHELLYFHRADDPYCQLMVQILPELMTRFYVQIKPIVVERLPADMYPDPQRYEAYTILDVIRQAKLYGLGFPSRAIVPDILSVRMANSYLADHQDDPDFFTLAEDVGAALWQRDVVGLQAICGDAPIEHSQVLRDNEKLLYQLGHYASANVYYGEEFYPGADRLDHLEARLNDLGLGDGERHYDLGRLWVEDVADRPFDASDQTIEIFYSARSPYSYLALEQCAYLQALTGVNVVIKPVLPMVKRGMKVPPSKVRYILSDTAREARANAIAFGRIAEPLPSVEDAMAIGHWAKSLGRDMNFYRAYSQAHFSKAIDGATDAGMISILEASKLSVRTGLAAKSDQSWRDEVEANRREMLRLGCWGVPTMKCGDVVVWGQDRLYAIVEALKNGEGR